MLKAERAGWLAGFVTGPECHATLSSRWQTMSGQDSSKDGRRKTIVLGKPIFKIQIWFWKIFPTFMMSPEFENRRTLKRADCKPELIVRAATVCEGILMLCVLPACLLPPYKPCRNCTGLVNNAWQTAWPGYQRHGLISRQQLLLLLVLLFFLKWEG